MNKQIFSGEMNFWDIFSTQRLQIVHPDFKHDDSHSSLLNTLTSWIMI